MKRTMLNFAALAVLLGGAQHLYASVPAPVVRECCEATFGAKCCGTTCSAGWFYCEAQL